MDTFFNILKKTLVGIIVLIFAFVVVYIPQQYNDRYEPVPEVEAFAFVDVINLVQNTIQAVTGVSLQTKEFVLDGIAWAIAKAIVSSMMSSLINWVNSGFEGRPAFLTDLGDFLLEAVDKGAGEYINSLGGLGSFICSPFKLDIQIVISLQYAQAREGKPPGGECTISGIVKNFEDFYDGSFGDTGWDDWFTITTQPEKYTELGQLFQAEAGLQRRMISDQQKAETEVKIGSGFLSGKICQMVEGSDTPKEKCTISKPGKMVQEALTFNIDGARQSLIQADEFNELIAALLGQLANKALTGAAGLLGLSAGTGYTYEGFSGGSYLSAMEEQSNQQTNTRLGGDSPTSDGFSDAITVQQEFRAIAEAYQPQLARVAADEDSDNQEAAAAAYSDAVNVISKTAQNEDRLREMQIEYQTLATELENPSITPQRRAEIQSRQSEILAEFSQLGVYTRSQMESSESLWRSLTS